MEENKAPQNFSQLCKLGCGYFGSSNFDGLCSQCYKEREDCEGFSRCQNVIREEIDERQKTEEECREVVQIKQSEESISSAKVKAEEAPLEATISITTIDCESKTTVLETSAKKSRCKICRKKLGLTGFGCRCGGEFCSIHRYSDSHSCTFDYKVEAENAIRKANPRIVSNKVSKI